jgi:hypothetical protein
MSRTINAMSRGDLQKGLRSVNKDLVKMTAVISGANSEPVKQAATVLQKNWRRILNVRGGGKPSSPGTPPRRQSGRLWKSIRQAVVDGVRRVGSGDFVAWMDEFGVDGRAPRPHARPALEVSQQQMTEVLIAESERLAATAPLGPS